MQKKILLKGPLLTRSGYGEQARYALRCLRSRPELFDIYIQPLTWGATSWLGELNEEREWIDSKIEKTISFIQQGGQFDMSLQVTIPNEWEQIAEVNVGYTAGMETTQIAHQWIEKSNMMDRIIVISNHSKDTFNNTVYQGVEERSGQQIELRNTTPITSVNYPAKTYDSLPELELELDYSFNFITVAQMGPRKNIENTIRWFVEEFENEEVGLIVKTNMAKNCYMDREHVYNNIRNLVSRYNAERKCKVYMLHGDMTDEEIHSLYVHPKVKAMLALTHGEGFGLPLFEAAYSGLPVICAGWSGQLDFLVDEQGKRHFYDVGFDLNQIPEEVVWEGVVIKESAWAYPREESAKSQMRKCYDELTGPDAEKITKEYADYAAEIHERFHQDKMYEQFVQTTYGEKIDLDSWLEELSEEVEEYE